MPTGIRVIDAMRKSVVTVNPEDTADKALRYMVDLDIGCVVVAENHKAVGMLTDGNLLERVFIKELDPKVLKVKDIMSHPIRTIDPETDLEDATKLMRDLGMKRLPVVTDNKLVGIITETDIIAVSPAVFEIVSERAEMKRTYAEQTGAMRYSGICEACGEYSDGLRESDGVLKCTECFE